MNTAKAFDVNKTNEYRLSIQVGLDGFSFLVFSGNTDGLLHCKKYPVKISTSKLIARHFSDWIKAEPLLNLNYKNVEILTFEDHFTLIPGEELLLNEADILVNPDNDRQIFDNYIVSDDVRILFGVNRELTQTIERLFRNVSWTHPVASVLNQFPTSEKQNTGIILQSGSNFYLIIKRKSQLLLANCFSAEHDTDLVYIVLNTFRQLGVSRSLTHMMVAGGMGNNKRLTEIVTPYFSVVSELKAAVIPGQSNIENISHTHLVLAAKQD